MLHVVVTVVVSRHVLFFHIWRVIEYVWVIWVIPVIWKVTICDVVVHC